MSDINIKSDFISIKMEMVEIEERLPSFKMKVNVTIFHPTGFFQYTADDIWFECGVWDKFIEELREGEGNSGKGAVLNDMNDYLVLKFRTGDMDKSLSVSIKEKFAGTDSELNFSQKLDPEIFVIIRGAFTDFTKWW